jgi:hypothetical protein
MGEGKGGGARGVGSPARRLLASPPHPNPGATASAQGPPGPFPRQGGRRISTARFQGTYKKPPLVSAPGAGGSSNANRTQLERLVKKEKTREGKASTVRYRNLKARRQPTGDTIPRASVNDRPGRRGTSQRGEKTRQEHRSICQLIAGTVGSCGIRSANGRPPDITENP